MNSVCPGRIDNITLLFVRVFLVKGVLKVLLEFSEPKGTWASKVNQAHGEPGASQDRMVCADNVANQAVLALTVWLALRASKENR